MFAGLLLEGAQVGGDVAEVAAPRFIAALAAVDDGHARLRRVNSHTNHWRRMPGPAAGSSMCQTILLDEAGQVAAVGMVSWWSVRYLRATTWM